MRFSIFASLVGLVRIAAAQNATDCGCTNPSTDTSSLTSSAVSSSTTTSSALTSSTTSHAATAITVAVDGSGQYTAINAAIVAAQNSAIPTVVVQSGTYSEALTIQGTQTLTIVGPTATDYTGNQVVIVASAPTTGVVSFNTQKSGGITFKNVNITNLNTGGTASTKAPAVNMYGKNMAFYSCALVSSGVGVYTASFGTTLIANSYIEGSDKLFYNYLTAYVYGSTIVPTASSSSVFFGQGYCSGTVCSNASLVVDSSTVTQKPGLSNSLVYLAAPNGNYTRAIYRNTALGGFVAPNGLRPGVCSYIAFYGEFETTGAGAMTSANAATRNGLCDLSLTASQVSSLTIDQLFGTAFSGYSSFDTTWIESNVLSSIQSSDAAQIASAPVVSSTTSSTTSSTVSSTTSTTTPSVVSSTTSSTTTSDVSSTTSSTSSPSASSSSTTSSLSTSSSASTTSTTSSATSTTASPSSSSSSTSDSTSTTASSTSSPSSVSSTLSSTSPVSSTTTSSSFTLTTPSSTTTSVAQSTTTTSATSSTTAAPVITVATDGSAQYTDINAALTAAFNSKVASVTVLPGTYLPVTIVGTQTITIAGPTATSYAQNQVVVAVSGTGAALSFGTSGSQGATFRNINFVNSATSGSAPAVNMKGINMAFYGCSIISGGSGVYTSSYGTTLIANSYVEGSDKLFTNFPTVYLFQSVIAPTASSASIFYAKGAQINSVWYNSTFVVDSSSVIQKAGTSNTGVYLATPNGATGYLQAVYRNTTLASLVTSAGVYSVTSCTVTALFGEFETTGAGSYASNSAARGSASCDYLLSANQVSAFTIDQVFGNAFYGYANAATSWIDAGVLAAMQSSDAAQVAAAPKSSVSSSSSVTSSTVSQSTGNSTATSATSTTPTATCATPAPSSTLVVSLNATNCQYPNVTAAINALPNDSKPYTILIMPGTYTEQLSITRSGKVTLIGQTTFVNDYTQNQVTLQFSNGQLTSAGKDESTPVIYAKKTDNSGLALYNINFVNTYPQTSNTAALAADFYGKNMAAYGCSFVGFQDTLLANQGTQLFSNCYIEGSIDYIWGFSTAYFHQCYIATNTKGACISAQSRTAGTVSGYVFDTCYVTYTSTYGSTFGASYLGRPYSNFSTAVYMNSYIDKHIAAAGWQVWQTNNPQTSNVTFGEYNNTGPGSWQSGTARASFATAFNATQAEAYTLANWLGDTSFIDMNAYNYVPSYSFVGASSTTSTGSTGTTTSSGSTTTATINAHPDSGTVPPQYAVIVSTDGKNGSFTNLTAALASLPSDSTNQTIFIYPGTYVEQVPSINRPGAIRIIGYTIGNPGQSYSDNEVTISFSRGLSVSPLPTGHSDAETATVSTASNRISFYNINIVNTDNLDGSESSYVTLAGSIYGNDIGFYACSFNGWQDTLLNGATAGYQYYESSYIGGAIDFIWGYSKAYFKGCTIGAKKAKSAMTAQSRASSSAIGGYIFDQCLFTQAPDATVDLTNTVYLGRPYSAYAVVVIKNSYIDDVINPSGWKVWSATDPRTDHITFAEYNNQGPSNWENNAAARLAFGNATLLTSDTYTLASVMDSTSWIDMTYWSSITTPLPAVVNTTTTTNVTVSGSSTYNGTVPPTGALIVSKTAIDGVTTYDTIQSALDAAPTSSKTNATIFIYPGIYEEQLIVNKSGTTIFMGYSDVTDDYSQNQVTIQQSTGVDTQGDGSDVDAATVYATGNYFYAYNINFRNNNGTQQNIASLGFAVKSSKYAFMHACQIYGNQDTLYISGNMFAFKSYVEGNVDFIFGAGLGYFLNSTISPNEDGDSITAAKRATNTTQAGFVFDQCSIIPANGATGFTNVSLGRPWNQYAQVAYIDCYLSSIVGSAGWTQWSKSSPQTDGVTFAEYHNYGPGSNTCHRAAFSEQLTDASVAQYQIGSFFTSTSWIDFSVVDVQPFTAGIGSVAPGCSALTVSSSTTSTRSSSTSSRTSTSTTSRSSTSTTSRSSTSTTSTTSVPVVTVYVTKTVTDKETATTTLIQPDVTSTIVSTVSENDGVTVTPSPVQKTTTIKATTVIDSTSTQAGKTTTVKSTEAVVVTSTVSGKDTTLKTTQTEVDTITVTGADTTVKSTTTVFDTTTVAGQTSTVKATTTVFATSTSSPKAVTTTTTVGSIVTSSTTITPAKVTVSSTSTITNAGSTKTTSLKASTITVTATSLKTTTVKTTVTETCTPAAAAKFLFRRGLEARAAGSTTITVSVPYTTFVKTSTITSAGSTSYTTIVSTSTYGSTTTLKAATQTVSVTALATSTSVIIESQATVTVTSHATSTQVSTVSVAGNIVTSVATTTSTVTDSIAGNTATNLATKTSVSTVSGAAATTTSFKTVSSTSVVTANQQTVTIMSSADSTTVISTTLPASTTTVMKTVTSSGAVATVTVTPAATTKTTTVKSTVSVTSTATKTSKNAPACTA